MAAKRSVLAVAVAGSVVTIGFLAFLGTRPDRPVITRAEGRSPDAPVRGIDAGVGAETADATLVTPDRPSPDGPRPEEVAAIVGGSVVVLDGEDGRTLRTLATHSEATTGGFPYLEAVTLAPDRSSVYYALAGDCGPATIYRVAASGEAPSEAILTGLSPAVSPDGRKLAYAVADARSSEAAPGAEERSCQNAVVVRDLQ